MLNELEEMGLTAAEAKTYLALLELGSTSAGPLIKKAELHRATVYDALKRLQEKGLASTVLVRKTRKFNAALPETLLRLEEDKVRRLKELLPKLEELAKSRNKKQGVWVYQGRRGIRTVMDAILDNLNPNGEYLDFGVSGKFREVMGAYWDLWQSIKKERGIKAKCIFSSKLKSNSRFLKDYFGDYRFHPARYESPTDTMIYNDTVVLFIWTGDPPIAVVIKNRENAEGYRKQFYMMWEFADRP